MVVYFCGHYILGTLWESVNMSGMFAKSPSLGTSPAFPTICQQYRQFLPAKIQKLYNIRYQQIVQNSKDFQQQYQCISFKLVSDKCFENQSLVVCKNVIKVYERLVLESAADQTDNHILKFTTKSINFINLLHWH